MERKYILAVKPLEPYILQIDFISGSRLLLDMKPYVELSHDEILSMAEREHLNWQ